MRPPARLRNASVERWWHVALLVSLVFGLSATPCFSEDDARGTELLATDHPAWLDLQDLWNRGGLSGLAVFTRPLPRLEIARHVALLSSEMPDLASLPAARRLRREFARELSSLGEPSEFTETPPLFESSDGATTFRAEAIGTIRSVFTDERGDVLPESQFGVALRAYLPGGAFVSVDGVIEDIEDEGPLGDAIAKGSDWYYSVPMAYIAVPTGFAAIYGGLFEQRWGPGSQGTLLLSDAAISYPGLFFARNFGTRVRFTAVTGALQMAQRRWFSAHRLELAVTDDLRVALQEGAAYRSSGFDPLYTIGIVPYSLVQRYLDRATSPGESVADHRNNVLAGADVVWRLARGWRIDGEFLVDDFATETATMPHRLAYQAGISWAGHLAGGATSARLEFVKVYRYTYSVYYGANFLQDGVPLGFGAGPDVEQTTAFVDRDFGLDFQLGAGCDWMRSGEGFAGEFWDPDDPQSPSSASALSGIVQTSLFPHARLRAFVRDLAWVNARVGVERTTNAGHVSGAEETSPRGEVDVRWEW